MKKVLLGVVACSAILGVVLWRVQARDGADGAPKPSAGADGGALVIGVGTRPDLTLLTRPRLADLDPSPKVEGTTARYTIDRRAVWSDGAPVTSADVASTARSRPEVIASVDATDPHVAVLRLASGVRWSSDVLDRIAPARDPDRTGGPWAITSDSSDAVVLEHNARWWGARPHLDRVTFRIIPAVPDLVAAYRTGSVSVVLAAPTDDVLALTQRTVVPSSRFDAIFFDTSSRPLDRVAVRRALAYATDRRSIALAIYRTIDPRIEPLQSLTVGGADEPFAAYEHDLDAVRSAMEGDGWRRGPDGIWAKGGARATLTLAPTGPDPGLQRVGEILASQWREAGFLLERNHPGGDVAVAPGPRAEATRPERELGALPLMVVPDLLVHTPRVHVTGALGDLADWWCRAGRC